MPQISPMSWLLIFIFTLSNMMMFFIKIHFLK